MVPQGEMLMLIMRPLLGEVSTRAISVQMAFIASCHRVSLSFSGVVACWPSLLPEPQLVSSAVCILLTMVTAVWPDFSNFERG